MVAAAKHAKGRLLVPTRSIVVRGLVSEAEEKLQTLNNTLKTKVHLC